MAKRDYSGLFLLIAVVSLVFGSLAQLGLTREVSASPLGLVIGKSNLIMGLVFFLIASILYLSRHGFSYFRTSSFVYSAQYVAMLVLYSLTFAVMVILVNYFAWKHEWFRYDSTEQQVFTFAPQTQALIDSVKDPVEIKAFFIAGDIDEKTRDFLERVSSNNPLISWSLVDPEKNTIIVDRYGVKKPGTLLFLKSFPSDSTSNLKMQTMQHVVLDDSISEESFSNALLKLVRPNVYHVYYLQGEGEGDMGSASKEGFQNLKIAVEAENITAKPLVLDEATPIPNDTDALLILGPAKPFLPVVLKKIKDYLDAGGRALVLLEPKSETNLPGLLGGYGINVGKDIVVDFISDSSDSKELGIRPVISQYGRHPVTKGFTQSIILSSVCSVQSMAHLPEGVSVSELAFSSASSWGETNIKLLFSDEPQANKEDTDIVGPVPIASAATKVVKIDGNQEEQKESRVVAIGDVDFASNIAIDDLYNRDFLLNAVNWLVGVDEGVTIRARAMRESRESISNKQFSEMYLITVIAVPELFLFVGVVLWWWRRSRA